jgi:hypothetical protein
MSGISKQSPNRRKANKEQLKKQVKQCVQPISALSSIEEDEKEGSQNSALSQEDLSTRYYPSSDDEDDRPQNTKASKEIRRARLALEVMEWASEEGHSKADMKLLIEGLAAQYGLRVIPVGISINNNQRGKSTDSQVEKPRKDRKTQEKAEYKSNPRWIELNSERTEVVSRLRETQKGSEENQVLVDRLRLIENESKSIKMDIRGRAAS